MQLTEEQVREFLNHNAHAADLFNMCKNEVPTSEFKASLVALVMDAQNQPTTELR